MGYNYSPSPRGGGLGWGHKDTPSAHHAPLPASPLWGEGLPRLRLALLLSALLTLTACGIKGNLTPPEQVQKEERSESNRAVGRDAVKSSPDRQDPVKPR